MTDTTKLPKPPKTRARSIVEGQHPDQRPCPSWCWVTTHGNDAVHEVDPEHVFDALHSTNKSYRTTASLYRGQRADVGDHTRRLTPAAVELNLEQVGDRAPMVRVALRTYGRAKRGDGQGWFDACKYDDERLRLSVEDARELAAMLEFLVRLADLPS